MAFFRLRKRIFRFNIGRPSALQPTPIFRLFFERKSQEIFGLFEKTSRHSKDVRWSMFIVRNLNWASYAIEKEMCCIARLRGSVRLSEHISSNSDYNSVLARFWMAVETDRFIKSYLWVTFRLFWFHRARRSVIAKIFCAFWLWLRQIISWADLIYPVNLTAWQFSFNRADYYPNSRISNSRTSYSCLS
jgi:hypothetical protein